MATSMAELPPASERQNHFEQSVAFALHLWPALTLSVTNQWGGPDSSEKRDWFAGAVVELFPEFSDTKPFSAKDEPDTEDVETVLLQVMVDEFEVNVDDESGEETAKLIVEARKECAQGQYDMYKTLSERFANRNGKKVDQMFKSVDAPSQEAGDQEGDWATDSDDDDDDDEGGVNVTMGEAPQLVKTPKEKPPPEVDEDGFTKVTNKR